MCLHALTCTACRYEAEVSVGDDGDAHVRTRTLCCGGCGELADAIVAVNNGGSWDVVSPQCPYCDSSDLSEWKPDDGCPACGTRMLDLGPTVTWAGGLRRVG